MGEKLRDKIAMQALNGMLAHSKRYVPRAGAPENWHDAIAQEAYEIADAMIEARGDGWIKWDGGERPVDGCTKVQVKLADGGADEFAMPADCYRWDNRANITDIIAYRVVKP